MDTGDFIGDLRANYGIMHDYLHLPPDWNSRCSPTYGDRPARLLSRHILNDTGVAEHLLCAVKYSIFPSAVSVLVTDSTSNDKALCSTWGV